MGDEGGVVALPGDEGGVVALVGCISLCGGLLLAHPVEAEEEAGALSFCCCCASARVVLLGFRFQCLGTWGLFWSRRA
jgi:hypothetical protein